MSKILLFTRIYDTEQQTLSQIEENVQADLDSYFGKSGMVKIEISSAENTVFYRLWRRYNDSEQGMFADSLRLEDCQLFTGHGCLNFEMPVSWGATPFLNAMPMIVWKDPNDIYPAYQKSCGKLGASVPRKMSAISTEHYFEVTLRYKSLKIKPEKAPEGEERKN